MIPPAYFRPAPQNPPVPGPILAGLRLCIALAVLGSVVALAISHVRTSYAFAGIATLLALTYFLLRGSDTTSYLVVFTTVLFLIPPQLGLNGQGITAAGLLALGCGWLWFYGSATGMLGDRAMPSPIHWALLLYLVAVLASLVAHALRPFDGPETNGANLGLINVIAAISVALLIADGVPTSCRLFTLVRALVVAGCVSAGVGIIQFFAEYDLSRLVRIPGFKLTAGSSFDTSTRNEFTRVIGLTGHAIEFSVVLVMLLPLALHLTYSAPPHRKGRWWVAVLLLCSAIPMSVSRSGAVGLLFVGLVLFPTWAGPRRRQALIASVVFLGAMKFLIPGLLGTIRGLFLNAGVDSSVTARTIDYSYVTRFISERPWFGRGNGTFLPTRYDFLDNQFLGTLVEMGIVGLVAVLALFAVGIVLCHRTRRRSRDPFVRDLAQSLIASLVVAIVSFGTFDFLAFQTARLLAFALLGCAAALWYIERCKPTCGFENWQARCNTNGGGTSLPSRAPTAGGTQAS